MASGGTFDKEATEEGLERADRTGLFPVSVGEDIFAAVRALNAEIDRVLAHDVPQPPQSLDFAQEAVAALKAKAFVDDVIALDRLLDVALSEMHRAKREDVLQLLADPLTTETRNTRRNLGVLTVLALLLGFAGKGPDSFLGLGMSSFPKWAFPMVLVVVIVYEFVAFTLYLNADLERRRVHSVAASFDRDLLLAVLADFERRQPVLAKFMSGDDAAELLRGMGTVDAAANLVPKCATLAAHWRQDANAFDREFRVQWRRRWWDEYVPLGLVAASGLALLSLIPPLRLWLWEHFHR